MPEELWMEAHNTVQEAVIKTIFKKKNCKKAKWLSEEALKISEIYSSECRVPKNGRRDKKALLSDQCKEREENNRRERLGISSRKLQIPMEYFMQRWTR